MGDSVTNETPERIVKTIEFANESLRQLEDTSDKEHYIDQFIRDKNNSLNDNGSIIHYPQNNEHELNPDNNDEYEDDISAQLIMKTSTLSSDESRHLYLSKKQNNHVYEQKTRQYHKQLNDHGESNNDNEDMASNSDLSYQLYYENVINDSI